MHQRSGGLLSIGELDLDFLAGLGGAGPPRSFIGDPVFISDGTHPERLVRHGEIARWVGQVGIDLEDTSGRQSAEPGQPPLEDAVIDRPILYFHFESHHFHVRRASWAGQQAQRLA
jgi:hypothetical protein